MTVLSPWLWAAEIFLVKYIETSQKILYNTIITITVLQIDNSLKKGEI